MNEKEELLKKIERLKTQNITKESYTVGGLYLIFKELDVMMHKLEKGGFQVDSNAIEMRAYDSYYCQKCDKVLKLNKTYIAYADKDRFVRCGCCHRLVNVQAVDGD